MDSAPFRDPIKDTPVNIQDFRITGSVLPGENRKLRSSVGGMQSVPRIVIQSTRQDDLLRGPPHDESPYQSFELH